MFRKSLAAFAFLVPASVLATAAQAVDFTFSFSAPWYNGDTATGSGVFTTADADSDGKYLVTGVAGTWSPYQSYVSGGMTYQPPVYSLALADSDYYAPWAGGFQPEGMPVYIRQLGGAFAVDGVSLYDGNGDNYLGFARADDGTYFASHGEVTSDAATLAIAAAVVPEPATWAMMVIGFATVGLGMRRRTKVVFA